MFLLFFLLSCSYTKIMIIWTKICLFSLIEKLKSAQNKYSTIEDFGTFWVKHDGNLWFHKKKSISVFIFVHPNRSNLFTTKKYPQPPGAENWKIVGSLGWPTVGWLFGIWKGHQQRPGHWKALESGLCDSDDNGWKIPTVWRCKFPVVTMMFVSFQGGVNHLKLEEWLELLWNFWRGLWDDMMILMIWRVSNKSTNCWLKKAVTWWYVSISDIFKNNE